MNQTPFLPHPSSLDTSILAIDSETGMLARDCLGPCPSESEALARLSAQGFVTQARGSACLGYSATPRVGGVLLATRLRQRACLPGGHRVYLVMDSQWVLVPLGTAASVFPLSHANAESHLSALDSCSVAEQEFWRCMQSFTLNNAHYFCETADLSRPFPSSHPAEDGDPEFVWNAWLAEPFRALGLRRLVPSLLQGAVESAGLGGLVPQPGPPHLERLSPGPSSTASLPLPGNGAGHAPAPPPGSGGASMCLVSRRSCLHPGTRYLARGLNAASGPGNEIECELVVWREVLGGGGESKRPFAVSAPSALLSYRWASLVWRRGTVPIWWGVTLQGVQRGLGAELYVRARAPYSGTADYFRRIQSSYAARGEGVLAETVVGVDAAGRVVGESVPLPAGSGEGSAAEPLDSEARRGSSAGGPAPPPAPVICVNLLHCNPKKQSELMLSSHFQESIRHVRRQMGAQFPVKVLNFDWHGTMGQLGEERAVEAFWVFVEPSLRETGLTVGRMQSSTQSEGGSGAGAAWPDDWTVSFERRQRGVLRFNCADSLDRTNAATCFAMLPALQEAAREVGVSIEAGCRGWGFGEADVGAGGQGISGTSMSQSASGPSISQSASGPSISQSASGPSISQSASGPSISQSASGPSISQSTLETQGSPGLGIQSSPGLESPGPSDLSLSALLSPLSAISKPSSSLQQLWREGRQALKGLGREGGAGEAPTTTSVPSASVALASTSDVLGPLPPGWEVQQRDGRSLYIDHHNRRTQWTRPEARGVASGPEAGGALFAPSCSSSQQPWRFFSYRSLSTVQRALARDVMSDFVDMFRVHGDIHSFLYTGSAAMHSHVLSVILPGGGGGRYGAASKVGRLQNLRLAVQRRWNNAVSDGVRHQAIGVFLGLDVSGHFPGLKPLYGRRESQGGEAAAGEEQLLGGGEEHEGGRRSETAPLSEPPAGPVAATPAVARAHGLASHPIAAHDAASLISLEQETSSTSSSQAGCLAEEAAGAGPLEAAWDLAPAPQQGFGAPAASDPQREMCDPLASIPLTGERARQGDIVDLLTGEI